MYYGIFSNRIAGIYNFEATIAENGIKTRALFYDSEEKTLYVNKGLKFAVRFKFGLPPPSGVIVSAMVLYAKPEDMRKHGPVKRCITHIHEGGGKMYDVSTITELSK